MHKNWTTKISKIALTTSIILATILAIVAIFTLSNHANAENANEMQSEDFLKGAIKLWKNNEKPISGTDYEYDLTQTTPKLTIKTPDMKLTGGDMPGDPGQDSSIAIVISSNSIYMDTFELNNPATEFTVADGQTNCDIYCVGSVQQSRSTFGGIKTLAFNSPVTLHGPSRLELTGGNLVCKSILTIDHCALEIYSTDKVTSSEYTLELNNGLKMNGGLLYSENYKADNSCAIKLTGKAELSEDSVIFATANSAAVVYNIQGSFNGFRGSEEKFKEYADKDKVTKNTVETSIGTSPETYTRSVIDSNAGPAKTITNSPLSPTPPEPAPEPVAPTEKLTAETGDSAGIAILGLAIIAIASFGVNVTSRKKINT